MAHDWHKSSRLAWQQVWPTGKNIFFLNYFILKYQFNVLLLGNYLQYLHDDTTDEKKVVLRSAGVIFIHILGDWGDLTSVRSEQRWSWATGCAGLVSIMALGHCYGESWRGAEERPAAWEAATFCFFVFLQTQTERSGPRVRLEIARNSSVGVSTSICTKLTHAPRGVSTRSQS